jgi:hypothetical protein
MCFFGYSGEDFGFCNAKELNEQLNNLPQHKEDSNAERD